MSKINLEKEWEKVLCAYNKYLKEHDVKIPSSYHTAKGFWLVYLFFHLGKKVKKRGIENFTRKQDESLSADQQVRHLKRDGWYLLTRNDIIPKSNETIKTGEYMLYTEKSPHPQFIKDKRLESLNDWETIKKEYDNTCATCGSKEGQEHRYFKGNRVTLQKGHMNPSKPMNDDNVIPQCSKCNDFYRDKFIFDRYGRIKDVYKSDK